MARRLIERLSVIKEIHELVVVLTKQAASHTGLTFAELVTV
jgi:hypothetical protein